MENDGKYGDIDEEAARWAARIDRGPLNQTEERALDRWLSGNSRHQGALVRAQALLVPCESVDRYISPDAVSTRSPRAKSPWLTGLAGLVAAFVFAFMLLQSPSADDAAFQTARGEVRRVPLEDGSVMTLNTASKADVDFRNGQRSIHLISGEGFFEVAHDAARPFVVSADDYTVKAIGTAFVVRKPTEHSLLVVVQEGIVEIGRKNGDPLRLEAGAMAEVNLRDLAPRITTLDGEQLTQELAWREGKIALTGETLEAAAAAFNRYNNIAIEVTPEVAQREVVGWYSANDPVGFAKVVAETMDVDIEITAHGIILKPLACSEPCKDDRF